MTFVIDQGCGCKEEIIKTSPNGTVMLKQMCKQHRKEADKRQKIRRERELINAKIESTELKCDFCHEPIGWIVEYDMEGNQIMCNKCKTS